MAEIETGSYNMLQPKQTMLENATGFAGLLAQQLQNKLQGGKIAAGQAVQRAINPLTGKVDVEVANSNIANTPEAAPYAAEAVQNNANLDSTQTANVHSKMDYAKGVFAALATKSDLNSSDLIHAATQLQNSGAVTAQQIGTFFSNIPPQGSMTDGDYSKILQSKMNDVLMQAQTAHETFGAKYPAANPITTQNQDGSNGVSLIQASPIPGIQPRILGQDGGAPAPVAPPNPNAGNLVANPGGQPVSAAMAQQPTAPPPGVPAWAVTAPAAGAGGPTLKNGALQTTLPAGAAENLQSSAKAYDDLRQTMPAVAQSLYFMGQAKDALKDTTTGTSSDITNAAKNFAVSMVGPDNLASIIGKDNAEKVVSGVVNYEGFRKDMANVVAQQATAGGTDKRLEQAIMGNPNEHLLNGTNQQLISAMMGLQRMQQAKLELFNKSGQAPGQFSNYAANFGKNIDPRAFAADLMPADKFKKMWNGMSDPEKAKFKESLTIARDTGVLNFGKSGGQ